MENLSLSYYGIHQIGIAIELILYLKNIKHVSHVSMYSVGWINNELVSYNVIEYFQ